MAYAENTEVPADRSRAEIDRLITKYGADQFLYGWSGDEARVGFRMHGKMIQFSLLMPSQTDKRFTHYRHGRSGNLVQRTPEAARKEWEQSTRQKWRALALVIKAKLEAVESGITTFETEFLAHIILPNGQTVGQVMLPQIETAYENGKMPPLLGWEPKP